MDDTQTQAEPRTKVLKNGAVYDLDTKRIVANPGGGTAALTQANASALARKRWENYRRSVVKRIVDEARSVDLTVSTGADAFGLVAAKQYSALMDSDKPKLDDLERLYRMMTGAMAANAQREDAPAPVGAISAAPETLLHLAELIERERSAAVDRARAIDAEPRADAK